MKHVIGALSMLTFILIACFGFTQIIKNTAAETHSLIHQAYEAKEPGIVITLVEEAVQFWGSKERLLGCVLPHDEVDEVGDSLEMMKAYAMQHEWDEFYGICAELLETLSHMQEKEQPLLQNIM